MSCRTNKNISRRNLSVLMGKVLGPLSKGFKSIIIHRYVTTLLWTNPLKALLWDLRSIARMITRTPLSQLEEEEVENTLQLIKIISLIVKTMRVSIKVVIGPKYLKTSSCRTQVTHTCKRMT